MNLVKTIVPAIGLVIASGSNALAHHPLGGETPQTFWHGFLSGIGHPMIGIDHFAFIVAVGLASAFLAKRALMPLAFVAATVAGCLLITSGVTLPAAELVITASVVLLGVLVLSGRTVPAALYLAVFAVAGLFHGGAYGEAVIGAEPTPIVAYLIAFGVTQYAIAFGAGWLATGFWKAAGPAAIQPRLMAAAVAGVGFAFLFENVEGMILG